MARWAPLLGLKWWNITYNYHDEPYTGDAYPDGRTPSARTSVDWDYNRATIHFYLSECKGSDDDYIERIVVHEMYHVLINEMRQWKDANDALSHEERVVCNLVTSAFWIRDAFKEKQK